MTAKPLSPEDAATIAYLRSPTAIRERCGQLFDLACADKLQYFRCDLSQLEKVADYVLQVTRESYPDLNIPFHSRWRHFEVGNQDRLTALDALAPLAKAKAKFDLAIVSVLLDAGAGDRWQYTEPGTGTVWRRSEGLAIASLHAFFQGIFSSDPQLPLQADAIGLQNLTEEALSQAFQVSQDNPLVGLSGRLALLQRLGTVIQQQPTLFGSQPARPGELVAYLCDRAHAGDRAHTGQIHKGQLEASTVLSAVLEGFGAIWAGRITLAEVNLGDVWVHSALAPTPDSQLPDPHSPLSTLVPFHKLSQWLTYSLLEPLQELGLTITGLDALTGLPEYRNGGLCVDLGLLQIKDPIVLQQTHLPGSEAIIEWRALTVILLDRLAETIRQTLNLSATDLPLVKILQGGTWTAGRRIAATLRPNGSPPIQIESDGTVF
ncbi:URC4/urg3 family protein [Phormidium sp. FACHB-592]|uniref:URC4/urg3 family protein n=1 Tax=Stenomitos frigidus AS-A4 TaxID=2933935 RepID=A0ABV0KLL8_9CYAN|nr:URC4/urg3 family protein [Phormidium sp. FACHB-592]MBD2075078.1 URC4/urg3 family protein [Phormidium sp. FACHB-592]